MTAASVHVCATTGRSCVTSTSASPRSSASAIRSWRICACTITSSAVVGSSASRSFGSHASAIAIAARWRIPPENSCGKLDARAAGMPTCSSSSPARRRAWAPLATPCSSIGSTIWSPTRCTGLNAFIAPWKTIATSRQRCGATVRSPRSRTFSPSSRTRPAALAVGGSNPISARIVVVLPLPDSPTSPSRWPRSTENETSWTAWSSRLCGRSNQTWRSSTWSSGAALTTAPSAAPAAAGSGGRTGARSAGAGSARPPSPGRSSCRRGRRSSPRPPAGRSPTTRC